MSFQFFARKRRSLGFTVIELLVVVAVLGILMVLAATSWTRQTLKARDAQRKDDLTRMSTAFEDYQNDNGQYPEPAMVADCNSESLQPYLVRVPCDPMSGDPYGYEVLNAGTAYRLFATLEDVDDRNIDDVGCREGCGPGGGYNYGRAQGVVLNQN